MDPGDPGTAGWGPSERAADNLPMVQRPQQLSWGGESEERRPKGSDSTHRKGTHKCNHQLPLRRGHWEDPRRSAEGMQVAH